MPFLVNRYVPEDIYIYPCNSWRELIYNSRTPGGYIRNRRILPCLSSVGFPLSFSDCVGNVATENDDVGGMNRRNVRTRGE